MLKQLVKIWQNNNGTMLAACAALVALLMSLAWRMELIPDIGPAVRGSPVLYGNRPKPPLNLLIVTITADALRDAEIKFQVFSSSEGTSADTLTPTMTHTAKLEGGMCEFVISDLSRGTFAGIAFLDVNGNDQLDLIDGVPTEPFGVARVRQRDDSKRLADGVFELSGEPVFVKIQLRQPATANEKETGNVGTSTPEGVKKR